MPGFKTPCRLEIIGNRDFRVLEPLVYESDNGDVYTVPAGQETDLASTWGIPGVAEKFDGMAPMSATLHDFCYRTGCVSRKDADALFYEAMYWESNYYEERGNQGIDNETRLAMFEGVRIGGHSSYQGKPEWNDII